MRPPEERPPPEVEAQAVLDTAAMDVSRALSGGERDVALRILLTAIGRITALRPESLARPPRIGDPKWDALMAAGVRLALRGRPHLPQWTEVRLEHPWFPTEGRGIMPDDYRASTIRHTPPELARANIFLRPPHGGFHGPDA